MKIFVDSDVIFDVLEKRRGFYSDSVKIFNLLYNKKCEGFTSPLILSNIFYLFEKYHSKKIAKEKIGYLLQLFTITTLNSTIAKKAYFSNFPDFEDAMQYFSCIYEDVPVLITRNKKDYFHSEISIFTPSEFIKNFF